MRIPSLDKTPCALSTTLFWPRGPGPFPLWVFNHGKRFGDPREQARSNPVALARMLTARGWAVAAPNRKGFADSEGHHVGYWRNPLSGALCCARDVDAVVRFLSQDARIDASRIVVAGHSYGALGTLAYGMKPAAGVRALVNFMGGLRPAGAGAFHEPLAGAFRHFGRRNALPSLWFYGENDSFWPLDVAHTLHAAFCERGAPAQFVNVGNFKDDAHGLVLDRDGVPYWWPRVAALLDTVTMTPSGNTA